MKVRRIVPSADPNMNFIRKKNLDIPDILNPMPSHLYLHTMPSFLPPPGPDPNALAGALVHLQVTIHTFCLSGLMLNSF